MNVLKPMLPHLAIIAAAYYLLPLAGKSMGGFMLLLLVINPIITFLASMAFGRRNGFAWYYPVAVAVLFLLSIFFFYNESAYVYLVAYGVLALVGSFVGAMTPGKKDKNSR